MKTLLILCPCAFLVSCAGLQTTTTTDTVMPDGTKIHAVATGANAQLIAPIVQAGIEAVTDVAIVKIRAEK